MGIITASKHYSAAPETVFDVLSDMEHADQRLSGVKSIEMLTDGPFGVGTRFRETRIIFKREATEEMEVTAFDRGRSYTVDCESCGCHYSTMIRCDPTPDGTEVTMEMRYTPLTFMAKVMSPLGAIMSGPMKKCIMKDLDDLEAHLS